MPAALVLGLGLLWALLVATSLRAPDPQGFFGGRSIADQREFYIAFAGNRHPVTLGDWSRSPVVVFGRSARLRAETGESVLLTTVQTNGRLDAEEPLPPGRGVYVFVDGIGALGRSAGPSVHVIDQHGLADPIASRLPLAVPRGLPGHERVLPVAWAMVEAGVVDPGSGAVEHVAALSCGPTGDLIGAIEDQLTIGRFLRNVVQSPRLTFLEVPSDPAEAAEACTSN
jgi:hypothetical protein